MTKNKDNRGNIMIIDSFLDSDLYKFSMQQCVLNQYPQTTVHYRFKCRNEGIKLGFLADRVREEVKHLAEVRLTADEKSYLQSLSFLTADYIDYLDNFQSNPDNVSINDNNGELEIDINGLWTETILFEVQILAIVNELYFQETSNFDTIRGGGIAKLKDKINLITQYPTLTIAEFGTRRRYSREWQRYVLQELLLRCPQVVGTSNVKLAMDFGIKAMGTQAHEYISAHLSLVEDRRQAQKRSLHVWLQEYGMDLGIALTDTFTTEAFFEDFDHVLARAFAGVRHDSGDPIKFGHDVIAHYKKLNIDPRTKVIIFSDGLDIPLAIKIFKEFTGRIGISFGIGTNLTNDLGVTPLNIVIKLIECNNKPVIKLSDNPNKAIGDPAMIKIVKNMYNITI